MPLSAKTVKRQLARFKPLFGSCSLETMRKGQEMLGELMGFRRQGCVIVKTHTFSSFEGAWVLPKDERRQGVLLYLHGGGYTCGGLEYATGVAATLADHCGARVLCPAYRLAPEHRYPAALEDVLETYEYLVDKKGYDPSRIMLVGESAGAGLCYALCLRLKALDRQLPCGIVAVSPWTDLTASGQSYIRNSAADPSMSLKQLSYFAESYTDDRTNPEVSPLFGKLSGLPASLIFVGGDEIMLDDAVAMHDRLKSEGCKSELIIKPERWHGYLMYDLEEDQHDFAILNRFLNRHLSQENKLRWMRLDNAAKIYPAARRQQWSNVFRLSVTLTEPIDTAVMQSALDVTVRRFPSIAVRLRKGMFWYYLQQLEKAPDIREENSYPLAIMSHSETRQCALRVIVYRSRVAVEFFHSLTDGNGGLVFLKSLVAEYLQQRYGVAIPATDGVLGRLEEPTDGELEDSFPKYAANTPVGRGATTAWHLSGTPEENLFLHLTCFELPVKAALDKAHEYGVSLNTFLCAVLMMALQNWQKEAVPRLKKRKPIKVLVPVNLRKLFQSTSLRNFAMYTTPEILPSLGEYGFEEICKTVHHHMGAHVTQRQMGRMIAANVASERMMAVRVMPLFIKNAVMKAVFDTVGERKSCLSFSNLGAVKVPEEMRTYVERMDFILGVQATAPYNCGAISYGDTLRINFIRNVKESHFERHVHLVLQSLGLTATVESN